MAMLSPSNMLRAYMLRVDMLRVQNHSRQCPTAC